jgi:hypothetical protein
MEARDIQLTNHMQGYVWTKPREQSQTLQIYPQGRQEMSYSAVSLVFSFSISDYVTYYLHSVLDLYLNFITWPQTSHILKFKTNSLVNFHDSLSRSASHNKYYTRRLQITDSAYTECSLCRLISHPGSFPEHHIGRHYGIPQQTEGHSFGDHLINKSVSITPSSVTEASFYCALFCLYGSCEI